MIEPVVIGIREVYDAVTELKGKFDQFVQTTAVDVALLRQRVEVLEAERTKRWQLWLALISAVVAIGMGTLSIVLK